MQSIVNRVNQDSDTSAESYADYTGNGRRLVGVLINDGYPTYKVVQIGAFLLLPVSEYDAGGNNPFCAEYVGAWLKGGAHKAVPPSGAHVARLIK